MREKISTVTVKDCLTQTFRVSGAGGQHRDKTSAGVRVVHEPSGARGQSTESRSQSQNKRKAFVRMARSSEFQVWAHRLASCAPDIDSMMSDGNLKIEVRENGRWTEISPA